MISCEWMGAQYKSRCALKDGISTQGDSDFGEQSGIYIVGPFNDIVGNRVSGQDNALFINQQGGHMYGQYPAYGMVAPAVSKLGRTQYNVFHNNAGFGWYVNGHFPLNGSVDKFGHITRWSDAIPFNLDDGHDQSTPILIEDHVEYQNDFAIGAYDLGDITMRNLTSVDGIKALYWKTYRRSARTDALLVDSVIRAPPQLPGGQGLVELNNVIIDTNQFDLNHHCGLGSEATGGLCASHFWIRNCTYLGAASTLKFRDETPKHETSTLVNYDGFTWLFASTGNPVFDVNAHCTETRPEAWGDIDWTLCPESLKLRSLRIFTPNRGTLVVTNKGIDYPIPFRTPQKGYSAGRYEAHSPRGKSWPVGYTMIVPADANISIYVPNALTKQDTPYYDVFTMEYSEVNWPAEEASSIHVRVHGDSRFAGGPFEIHNSHSRDWITPYGPLIPTSGAWFQRRPWSVSYTIHDYRREFEEKTDGYSRFPMPPPPPPSPASPPPTPPHAPPPPEPPAIPPPPSTPTAAAAPPAVVTTASITAAYKSASTTTTGSPAAAKSTTQSTVVLLLRDHRRQGTRGQWRASDWFRARGGYRQVLRRLPRRSDVRRVRPIR